MASPSWCPRRHVDMALLAAAVVLVCICLAGGPSATAAKQTNQVAVFWGRSKDEGTLREACDTGLYTTVLIAFYSVFGQGRYWRGDDLPAHGHQLSVVGADIKHCQARGILVLLSIGGGGHGYSLPSSQSAADVADHLWNAHLGGRQEGVIRPFGDAAVDGIDFYIDNGEAEDAEHYAELARRLAGHNGVRLTASPRCGCPDARVDGPLQTGLFERIHVRFYGDDACSFKNGSTWGVVEEWRKWTARYPKAEVYLGLAAAESGVPDGPARGTVAVYLKYLYYLLLPEVQKAGNYGGVVVWDRYEDKRTGYSGVIKGWA